MIKKKYVLLLCEDEFDGEQFLDKRRLEIASSDSTFMGQAQNIMFYTKIDGTHELSFEVNKFYFDESIGKKVKNELIDRLVNKCKIEAIIEQTDGSMKSFFMVINKREDKKEGKIISFSYSCTDAFIEELSKTGYQLEFSDDIELQNSGLTIGEFATQILADTDWEYVEENTDTLYEYTTDLEYDFDQERYNEKYTPVPSHFVKFIPEIGGFANKMVPYKKVSYIDDQTQELKEEYHPIYCCEETQNVTVDTVQNILYNTKDCTSTTGWEGYGYTELTGKYDQSQVIIAAEQRRDEVAVENQKYDLVAYCLNTDQYMVLVNTTAAAANTKIEKHKRYLFKYSKVRYNTDTPAGAFTLKSITISSGSPGAANAKSMTAIGTDTDGVHTGFKPDTYYILRPTDSINNPQFFFNFGRNNYHKDNKLELTNIEFFELKGTDENNDLYLANNYSGGEKLKDEDFNKVIFLPESMSISPISSYTSPITKYFIRNTEYYLDGEHFEEYSDIDEDDLTFLDFRTEVYTSDNYVKNGDSWISLSTEKEIDEELYKDTQIDVENRDRGAAALDTIYYCGVDGKYYQYYYLENVKVNGQISSGGMWGLALLGDGKNDKKRILVAEKSNRFNLIQDLSELFKVWPVFNIYRDKDGKIIKQLWFKETCLKETFSGFHAGVNIKALTRTVESDEIVTKMYVEDIENQYVGDGAVSIVDAKMNPLSEKFCYNFRYYVEQKLLNQRIVKNTVTYLLIDYDLQQLYKIVNPLNQRIIELGRQSADVGMDLNNVKERRHGLSHQISSAQLMQKEIQESLDRTSDFGGDEIQPSEKTVQKLQEDLAHWKAIEEQCLAEDAVLTDKEEILQKDFDQIQEEIKTKTEEKKSSICNFEKKYSQYIKEGTWTDSSYIDSDTYYYDAQKVSNTSAEPKVSWTISIIDGNCFEELKEFKVDVGDKTFLVDPDFFDNKDATYKFEILITGYKDYLDNPVKNEIEVRNYQTSFEDLFQRIAAATQTLTLNEQTYDKAALLSTTKGIDISMFQKTLLNNAVTLINSSNNDILLDSSGLTLKSITNPVQQLRAISEGIFLSDSVDEAGNPIWKTGISAEGINASVITSGRINTSEIDIYCGDQLGFKWDSLGITALQPKDSEGKLEFNDNQFIRFDGFGLYFVNNKSSFGYNTDGTPWYINKSYENALQIIKEEAEVSITEDGFRLNIENSNGGQLLLGPNTDYDPVSGREDKTYFGFYIKEGEKTLVRLREDGLCMIGDWLIKEEMFMYYPISPDYSPDENTAIFGVGDLMISQTGKLWVPKIYIGIDPPSIYYGGEYAKINFSNTTGDSYFHKRIYLNGELMIPDGQGGWTPVDFSGGGGGGTSFLQCPLHIEYRVTQEFKPGTDGHGANGHGGIDLGRAIGGTSIEGQNIYAAAAGTIIEKVANHSSYGNYIVIDHGEQEVEGRGTNHYYTLYAHCKTFGNFNVGDNVTANDVIATVGNTGVSTGPHLHFEVREGGNSTSYRENPRIYINFDGNPPTPTPPAGSGYGLDISKHQGTMEFDAIMNSGFKDFVIIRAGFTGTGTGTSHNKDNQFERNYSEAKTNNIPVGCYWYSCANTYQKGYNEAQYLYNNCLVGKQFEYPIYIDVEDPTWQAGNKRGVTDAIKGFCDYLQAQNFYPGIYASDISGFQNKMYLEELSNYEKWVARYGSSPKYVSEYGIWQYSSTGTISGHTGNLDLNVTYKDYPIYIKNNHLNGF